MKTLIAALAIAGALTTSTLAGDNRCYGTIQVGKVWTVVHNTIDKCEKQGKNYYPLPRHCKFLTDSKLSKRVLKTCPDGTACEIHLDLDHGISKASPATSCNSPNPPDIISEAYRINKWPN